jgi:hypothetical protein
MRRRRVFAVICILALAMGAGYFLKRGAPVGRAIPPTAPSTAQSEPKADSAIAVARKQPANRGVASSSPLPPPGTPLKDIYDELAARARSGDRAASVRLYRDTTKCRFAKLTRRLLSITTPTLLRLTDPSDPKLNREFADSELEYAREKIAWLKKVEPICDDLDEEASQSSPDWTRLAAQQGDREAIDCYLDQDFINVNDAVQHLQWLDDFRHIAPAMADQAVANGDWKAVVMLEQAYDGGGAVTSWLTQTIAPNPEQAYRYLELLALGHASNDFLKERQNTLESELAPNQIAAAKAWANRVFTYNFQQSPAVHWEIKTICPNPMTWPD